MIRAFTIAVLIMSLMSASSTFAGTWSDGFEHPELDDEWELHIYSGNQPVWHIENRLLFADHSGCSAAWIGKDTWENYSVEATVILLDERPPGPNTPDAHEAGIIMYSKIAPCQGYFGLICTHLWDGRGAGFFAGVVNGWGLFGATAYKALKVNLGREYRLRMIEEKKLIKCYLDDESVLEFNKSYIAGVAGPFVANAKAHFDDFVVTGANIPNGGPGLGKAVNPKAGVATTWAYIKQ